MDDSIVLVLTRKYPAALIGVGIGIGIDIESRADPDADTDGRLCALENAHSCSKS
jgi:hypothetical protein